MGDLQNVISVSEMLSRAPLARMEGAPSLGLSPGKGSWLHCQGWRLFRQGRIGDFLTPILGDPCLEVRGCG